MTDNSMDGDLLVEGNLEDWDSEPRTLYLLDGVDGVESVGFRFGVGNY